MKNDKPGWSFPLAVLERMAKIKEFSLFMSNFLIRLLQLLVCLGLPATLMAAAPGELPGKDVTPLEEVVRPVSKVRSQDLAQPQQPLPPLEVFDSLQHVAHRARRGLPRRRKDRILLPTSDRNATGRPPGVSFASPRCVRSSW